MAEIFSVFSYGRAHSVARALYGFDATSCYAARSGGRNAPKGLMPFGFPQCEKVATLRFAHLFAKPDIFSVCERGLKKAALTKVTRKRPGKRFCQLRRTSVQLTFQQKRFCHLRLPLVVAAWREIQYKCLRLSPPSSLKSGNRREAPEGTSELTFFGTFFVQRQRKYIKTAQRGAKLYARQKERL